MNTLSIVVITASVLLLTACVSNGVSTNETTSATQVATQTVPSYAATREYAPTGDVTMEPAVTALDGKWECGSEDEHHQMLELAISGNVLRDTVSNAPIILAHGKGIELGAQVFSYTDAGSRQTGYAQAMKQVDKPGHASIFSSEFYGGAGAGVEFSLNPNDTLKISDYSSMAGTETVGLVIPMSCRRIQA